MAVIPLLLTRRDSLTPELPHTVGEIVGGTQLAPTHLVLFYFSTPPWILPIDDPHPSVAPVPDILHLYMKTARTSHEAKSLR